MSESIKKKITSGLTNFKGDSSKFRQGSNSSPKRARSPLDQTIGNKLSNVLDKGNDFRNSFNSIKQRNSSQRKQSGSEDLEEQLMKWEMMNPK